METEWLYQNLKQNILERDFSQSSDSYSLIFTDSFKLSSLISFGRPEWKIHRWFIGRTCCGGSGGGEDTVGCVTD